jgi:hypothetical protein
MELTASALASGRPGAIVGAVLTSRTVVANALDLIISQANPTWASSDNAAIDITDANLEAAQIVGCIKFAAADWITTASNQFCVGKMPSGADVNIPFVCSGADDLWGQFVIRTAAGQWGGTTDLVLALIINQY